MRTEYSCSRAFGLLVSVILLLTVACVFAGGSGMVHYQVTYQNGEVRDMAEPPKTNTGIRMVVKISRYEAPVVGHEVLSTERSRIVISNPPRTYQHKLTWNGSAWVADPAQREPQPASAVVKTVKVDEIVRLRAIVAALERKLKFLNLAVLEQQGGLFEAAGTADATDARFELAAVQAMRNKTSKALAKHKKLLAQAIKSRDAKKSDTSPLAAEPVPAGNWQAAGVDFQFTSLGQNAIGAARAFHPSEVRVAGHRVQVWRLPDDRRKRKCVVYMGHGRAGLAGAFYYVAYADTTGDGLPDKLIGRSSLAQAVRAARWTKWEFVTDYCSVFIGNAWRSADTAVYYCQPCGGRRNWRGLSGEVYLSLDFDGLPIKKANNHATNMRICVEALD